MKTFEEFMTEAKYYTFRFTIKQSITVDGVSLKKKDPPVDVKARNVREAWIKFGKKKGISKRSILDLDHPKILNIKNLDL